MCGEAAVGGTVVVGTVVSQEENSVSEPAL